MGSVFLLAIGVAVAVALLSSAAFSFLNTLPEISQYAELEKSCENIALEGYKMHLKYPESGPDEMQIDDMNRMLYLDELWINDCVNGGLPADILFDIIHRVEIDFHSGE